MMEVPTTSSKTGVAYDNRSYPPAASAYDRGYELAQALCAHPAQPHLQLQAVCRISQALTRYRDMRGPAPVPAAPGRDRHEHLQPQPHHDWSSVPVSGDAAAARPRCRDLSPARGREDSAGHEP